jgi:7,8-dihydropterin-6-yl-methyl-4-(beta-D-ribofuranosyl)aminobenzene 5'-phosphate synthase
MTPRPRRLVWLLLTAIIAFACATSCAAQNRITILNDAFGKKPALDPDWGFSALVEFEGKRILFDTGDNAAVFQKNVEQMHIDLSHLDMVVISHAHGDHTSGLRYVLSLNPQVPLFVPDDPYFTGNPLPAAFLSTDARKELPPEMRYFGGNAPPRPRGWQAWTDTKMTVVNGPVAITPHLHLVALVSEKPAFKGLHEISLVLDTPQGPVVVAGCSHPGIEAIIAAATAPDPSKPVYMVFGGLHLLQDTRDQIAATLTVLSDQFHVQKIAIGHCTGELAFQMIQQKWGGNYQYAGLGEVVAF